LRSESYSSRSSVEVVLEWPGLPFHLAINYNCYTRCGLIHAIMIGQFIVDSGVRGKILPMRLSRSSSIHLTFRYIIISLKVPIYRIKSDRVFASTDYHCAFVRHNVKTSFAI